MPYSWETKSNTSQQSSQPNKPSLLDTLNHIAGSLGVQKLAQGIATTGRVISGHANQSSNEEAAALLQMGNILKNSPPGSAERQRALAHFDSMYHGGISTQAEIDPGTKLSNREVIGSALSTAGLAAGGGVGADAAAEAVSGGVTKGLVGGAIAGAETGAATGAGEALQKNKNIIKGAVKGGAVGGVLGGALGGAAGAASNAVKGAFNTTRRVFSSSSDIEPELQTALDSFKTNISADEQALAAQQGRGMVKGDRKSVV